MNAKTKYWISLLSLGYMGGTIYVLPYIRYTFYTQMMECMNITNTQVGLLSTVFAVVTAVTMLPGGMFADRADAKKIIIFSIGATTLVTFIHALFPHSYAIAMAVWAAMGITTGFAYWPALQKYILSLGNKDEQGRSYGRYYLVNGLSGALGNALPLWVMTKMNAGYPAVVWTVGCITLLATILVAVFLESEEDKLKRGVIMESEDEPPRLSDVGTVLKWPGTWIYWFACSLGLYTLYAQVSYFTPYLTDVIGIDPSQSSWVSIVRTYVTMVMAPVGGFMADKVFKGKTSRFICICGAIIGVMIAGIFMFKEDANPTLVAIYTVLPSIIIMAVYSVRYSLWRELHTPQSMLGTTIGVLSFLPICDGLIPPLFGHWLDKYGNGGYRYIFMFLIFCAICAFTMSIAAQWLDKKCLAGEKHIRGLDWLKAHPGALDEIRRQYNLEPIEETLYGNDPIWLEAKANGVVYGAEAAEEVVSDAAVEAEGVVETLVEEADKMAEQAVEVEAAVAEAVEEAGEAVAEDITDKIDG